MEPEKKSNGALVGLVIIVIILLLGAVYVWKSKAKNTIETNINNVAITNQETSDINALEQDLKTTDTNIGIDVNALQ